MASALMLAFLRGDDNAGLSLLEDASGDVAPFAIGLASHAKTIAEMTGGLPRV